MSQAGVVSWLAVRELWMSFRLLLVLVATVVAGAAVALLPAPLPVTMERLAIGLGIAAVVAGLVAAWSLAGERRGGRTGWLIARAVPRATYLSGWFAALGGIVLLGHTVASALGWVAAVGVGAQLDVATYVAVAVATLAASLASLALGALAGVLWPPPIAAAIVVVVGAALAAAAVLGAGVIDTAWLPAAGAYVELAAYGDRSATVGSALLAGGVALLAAGLLLGLARLALERVEL